MHLTVIGTMMITVAISLAVREVEVVSIKTQTRDRTNVMAKATTISWIPLIGLRTSTQMRIPRQTLTLMTMVPPFRNLTERTPSTHVYPTENSFLPLGLKSSYFTVKERRARRVVTSALGIVGTSIRLVSVGR